MHGYSLEKVTASLQLDGKCIKQPDGLAGLIRKTGRRDGFSDQQERTPLLAGVEARVSVVGDVTFTDMTPDRKGEYFAK